MMNTTIVSMPIWPGLDNSETLRQMRESRKATEGMTTKVIAREILSNRRAGKQKRTRRS